MNSFSTNPESQTVNEGDTLLLFCIHGGSVPPASITWTRNGNVVSPTFRILVQSSVLGHTAPPRVTSTLAITSVVTSDAGMYRCVATNVLFPGSDVQSQQATIAVRGERIRSKLFEVYVLHVILFGSLSICVPLMNICVKFSV